MNPQCDRKMQNTKERSEEGRRRQEVCVLQEVARGILEWRGGQAEKKFDMRAHKASSKAARLFLEK